jgi:hypothetical protein
MSNDISGCRIGGTPVDPIQRLHNLDRTLTAIASWRKACADNVPLAEAMDAEWLRLDEERQELRAVISDRELTRYEVERHEINWVAQY